ncbi:MAG: MFS transporter [Lewinellaceae bacterium]|nr:MFS transporter [Lewinellaceae bacterium]
MAASDLIKKNDPKTINAWAMYDWANSVYALVIVSAIFPAYYNEVTRTNGSNRVDFLGLDVENTAIYSICLGAAFGIVGLLSPLVSSVADYLGNHKAFMKFFCYLGGVACAGLFLFTGENLEWGLSMLMLATIGYSGSIVFYNAYLPAIATEDRQDRVSACLRLWLYRWVDLTDSQLNAHSEPKGTGELRMVPSFPGFPFFSPDYGGLDSPRLPLIYSQIGYLPGKKRSPLLNGYRNCKGVSDHYPA